MYKSSGKIQQKMEFRTPAALNYEGNLAENFRKFKQSFEIYLIASGKN